MYRYMGEVRHDHVTLSKVCESHKFAIPANAVFDASRETWCALAESPEEVLKPKEERIWQLFRIDM